MSLNNTMAVKKYILSYTYKYSRQLYSNINNANCHCKKGKDYLNRSTCNACKDDFVFVFPVFETSNKMSYRMKLRLLFTEF